MADSVGINGFAALAACDIHACGFLSHVVGAGVKSVVL